MRHAPTRTIIRRLLTGGCCLLALFALASVAGAEPQTYHAVELGGEVVPHVSLVDLRDLPTVADWEPGDPIVVNPRRWLGDVPEAPATPAKRDPLLDVQAAFDASKMGSSLVEEANFAGLDSGAVPPDPTMDVGPDYVIQAINGGGTTWAIFNKDGTIAAGPMTLDDLGTGACANGLGDPIILYDSLAGRWFLSEFSASANALCVYVSMTDDPVSGGWCNYQFNTPSFPDYPKYGVWHDAYYATSNEGGGNRPVHIFDRENMLACDTARPLQTVFVPDLPGLGFEALTPADVDGSSVTTTPAVMMRHRDDELHDPGSNDPATDILELWEVTVDWDNSANTVVTGPQNILVSEFDSNLCPPLNVFSCIPQPGTNVRLDPLLEVIMYRLAYRNFGTHESIVGVLQTDIGDFEDHSGERWFELRRTGGAEGSGWSLFQEGTYSPDAEHRFMGTIAMDGDGNILLGYNLSSSSTFPSIRYTGRHADDPLGTMSQPEGTLVAGGGSNNFNRYGDYSQMGVDPADECTFWITAEYNPTASSDTRIGAIRFESCLGGAIFLDGFETGDTTQWSLAFP